MDDIQFMHYRTYDDDKNLFGPDCHGGVTLAIHIVSDKKAVVAMARCSMDDIFNKKLGRTIALGRLKAYESGESRSAENILLIDLEDDSTAKSSVHKVVGSFMSENGFH